MAKRRKMDLSRLLWLGLIGFSTKIYIRDTGFHVLASGTLFDKSVTRYQKAEIEDFTWQDDNAIYIDLKQ